MPRKLTPATTLDHLRKEAKRWLKALRADDVQARERFKQAHPHAPARPGLRDVQHALAREYGEDSWKDLRQALEVRPAASSDPPSQAAELLEIAAGGDLNDETARMQTEYEQLARDLVTVSHVDDDEALGRLGRAFDRIVSFEQIRAMLKRVTDKPLPLDIEKARELIARHVAGAAAPAQNRSAAPFEQLARDFVDAYDSKDTAALERLNRHYGRSFNLDDHAAEIWHRVYAFRQRSRRVPKNYVQLSEAQIVIAQDAGFSSWSALLESAAKGGPPPRDLYEIDLDKKRIAPRRRLRGDEWDELLAAIEEHGIASVEAHGTMKDDVLARISRLNQITGLSIGGSRELSDDGLLHLANMPQLEVLNLSEYPGGKLTDRGLEVLRHLPNLRRFEMTWQAGISDAGIGNLRFCDRLEHVDLMGSPTGDGAIEALQGKPQLRYFSSGRLVTDAGLPLLHNFPLMKHGGGAHLLIDGPFSNDGLASIAGLAGVSELDLFWHVTGITSDAFAHLRNLPNLESMACDGELSDDRAMAHFGAIPKLRKLRAQEAAATDDGFVALSQSRTLESFWGRECANFGSRGFIAFSKMPSLRGLGVSCKNVDDRALSTLPDFPELRELTPIGVQDDGFRHIGRCPKLERLTCMYCRDTSDVATEHIAGLHIKYYYAGLTKITDRSLEILGRIQSLEQIDFYECNGITDAGLIFLAALPRLRGIQLESLPGVTLEGTRVFPKHVRVHYST